MREVKKPWGKEVIWADTANYVGKVLHINAGHRLSLQFHRVKEETIYVLSGILYVYDNEGKVTRLTPGQTFHVKPLQVHRFGANECNVQHIIARGRQGLPSLKAGSPKAGGGKREKEKEKREQKINKEEKRKKE